MPTAVMIALVPTVVRTGLPRRRFALVGPLTAYIQVSSEWSLTKAIHQRRRRNLLTSVGPAMSLQTEA